MSFLPGPRGTAARLTPHAPKPPEPHVPDACTPRGRDLAAQTAGLAGRELLGAATPQRVCPARPAPLQERPRRKH